MILFVEMDSRQALTEQNNNEVPIKQEDQDTDSDFDAQTNVGTHSRNVPAWYPCDGQI